MGSAADPRPAAERREPLEHVPREQVLVLGLLDRAMAAEYRRVTAVNAVYGHRYLFGLADQAASGRPSPAPEAPRQARAGRPGLAAPERRVRPGRDVRVRTTTGTAFYGVAPRGGLEPPARRLQVPRHFCRAWTISSPACFQGRAPGAGEALSARAPQPLVSARSCLHLALSAGSAQDYRSDRPLADRGRLP